MVYQFAAILHCEWLILQNKDNYELNFKKGLSTGIIPKILDSNILKTLQPADHKYLYIF